MKLNLLFIVMALLTLLAYPIVYVDGRLRQFSKSKEGIHLANLLMADSITPGDDQLEDCEREKER